MIDENVNIDDWKSILDCFYEISVEDYAFARNVRVLQLPDGRVGFLCITPCQNGFPVKYLKPIVQYFDATPHYLVMEGYAGKVAVILY